VCMGAQPELDCGGTRNPDGQGFAAFGRVVEGMELVRAIHAGGASAGPPTADMEGLRGQVSVACWGDCYAKHLAG
jgi:peptidyl-prolyl cis-trans isomerase A (cyclophilin A)